MHARLISFGLIEIDGQRFEHDVVLEQGVIRKRKKGPSKVHRERYGHTPLSIDEAIPWSAAHHARAVRGGTPARRGGRR